MAIPKPGRKVRGSASGRPIMAALDLLGRRWTLRILWELRARPLTFRAIRETCESVSPTVLNTRLRELKEGGIVETSPEGYALTADGRRLVGALTPLHAWAKDWARHLR